jgi:hypothetical protein
VNYFCKFVIFLVEKELRLIHIIPNSCNTLLGERCVEVAPPSSYPRLKEVRENHRSWPHSTNEKVSVPLAKEIVIG